MGNSGLPYRLNLAMKSEVADKHPKFRKNLIDGRTEEKGIKVAAE